MKNNKNVRKDNLSPVENGSKRIYKMYKSKKNWVVAPVVLLTLLGAVAPAPIALTNVVNAEETTATDLAAQREDAKAKIADLVQYGLTKDEVKTYQEAVDGLTTGFDAKIEEARVQASKNQLAAFDEAKTNAETKIASLTNLPTSYSAEYPTKPTYSNPDGKTDKALVELAKAVSDAKSTIATLVNDATELNTAFATVDSAKAYVTTKVNSLAFVNEAYKAERVSELKTVDSKDDVYRVLTTAKSQDDTNKQALVDKVTNKANTLFANVSDKADKVNEYTNKANAAKTPAEINALISELDAKLFEKNKEAFKVQVNNFSKYGDEKQAFKDYFLNELNAVTNQEQLEALEGKFSFVDTYSDLAGIKAQVTSEIGTVNPNTGLVNLGFANPIKKADALRTVDKSNSALEVAKLFFSLKDEDAKILADAKAKAISDINALSNLKQDEKNTYITSVNAANAKTAVEKANEAKKLNDSRVDSETLAALKAKARESFKLLGLQDTSSIDAIHGNTPESLKQVKNVVTNKVAELNNTNIIFDTAKNLVNALIGIDSYKEDILKALEADKNDSTKLSTDVSNAIQTSRNEAEVAFNADKLAEAIKNAIDEVKKMKYLSDEAKDDYTKALKAAKSESDVTTISDKAEQANNSAMQIAQELAEAKSTAVTQIGELSHLSPSQAGSFVEQIRSAATTKDVNAIANKAILADIDAITDLSEYKTVVADKLLTTDTTKALRFAELTPQQVAAHIKDVEAAKTLEDAKKAVAEAQTKNAKQNDERVTAELDQLIKEGNYSQAKVKLASLMLPENISKYTKIVDDALALREKKLAALDTIAKADYLSATEKEKLAKEVSAAKDIAEVDKVLATVTDKAPATAVQLYRLYNPYSHEHLYTASKDEYDYLGTIGWQQEEFAWTAPSKGEEVYRLYNPFSGEHFYTMSTKEYNDLAKLGWKQEGLAFYSNSKDGNPLDGSVSIYRLFNPYEKGAGSHHFTTSTEERDHLVSLGWNAEGVGFFGLKK